MEWLQNEGVDVSKRILGILNDGPSETVIASVDARLILKPSSSYLDFSRTNVLAYDFV